MNKCMQLSVVFLFVLISCLEISAKEQHRDKVIETTPDKVWKDSMQVIFSGQEALHYSISWSGGVKIGDLYMNIRKTATDEFSIEMHVSDYGLFRLVYPVDDNFVTSLRGEMKLPYKYEVVQREGRSKPIKRHYRFDQQTHTVTYKKNDLPTETLVMDGTLYNEFAAFIMTRALDFARAGKRIVIPVFADKKRHEVSVRQKCKEQVKNTLFGKVNTIKVQPIMSFKGLYDKDGDTVIWVTDDVCRIPVIINSKIVVGSLTAKLIEYHNPACPVSRYQHKVTSEKKK